MSTSSMSTSLLLNPRGLHVHTKYASSTLKILLHTSVKSIITSRTHARPCGHGAYTMTGGAGFVEEGEEGLCGVEKRYSR